MATRTTFYEFIPSKEEEERAGGSVSFPLSPILSHEVELGGHPPRLLDLFSPWECRKVLSATDVGHLGGLILGREHVQRHWGLDWDGINHEQQVPVIIWDVDTQTEYVIYLRKYTNGGHFILTNSWVRDFVIRRNLREGDTIGLFWNRSSSSLCFSILKRAEA